MQMSDNPIVMNNAIRLELAELADCITSYLALIGVFYSCVFIIGMLYIMCRETMHPHGGMLSCFRRIGRLALFLTALLMVGDFYSVIWSAMIHNHMYHSAGYDGVDFVPWYPITRDLVESTYGADSGKLIGVTLFQLQVIWLVFSIATWTSTVVVFEWISTPEEVCSRRRIGSRG
jgi:hypothetical protein